MDAIGSWAQAIWKTTCAVAPDVTVTVAGFSPDTVQFDATPLSVTV